MLLTPNKLEAQAFHTYRALGGSTREWVKYGHKLPEIRGAAGPVAQHPLSAPTLSGTLITIDTMLDQPTRITRILSDLTLQKFLLDRLFTSAGGVTGGAVVYDMATVNELYLERDVQRVEPGAEFPVVTSDRRPPSIALVEKWGGKVWISDEARTRNSSVLFMNELRKLGNTMVRKLNQKAIDVVEAAITANGGASNTTGNNWNTVVTGGSSMSNATLWPAADFSKAQLLADTAELGITFDLWIVNPAQAAQAALLYGAAFGDVLRSYGISMYASNRVAAGTAYAVASGQLGELRIEKPLGTETWREEKTERTWVQSSVRPVMYVTNPYAIIKFTGLAG